MKPSEIRNAQAKAKAHELNPIRKLGLNSGVVGQGNERLVAIELEKMGYKVCLPFDTTCPFDLAALYQNVPLAMGWRIQVKTGSMKSKTVRNPVGINNVKYDYIAIVFDMERIEWYPGIPHNKNDNYKCETTVFPGVVKNKSNT